MSFVSEIIPPELEESIKSKVSEEIQKNINKKA